MGAAACDTYLFRKPCKTLHDLRCLPCIPSLQQARLAQADLPELSGRQVSLTKAQAAARGAALRLGAQADIG